MNTRVRPEGDEWSGEGSKITAPEKLAAIRSVLETEGPILVEHWFYRGGRGPRNLVFEEFDAFLAYLNEHASAGDAIDVWSLWRVCKPDSRIAEGKCPDDNGDVPRRGAY
jgi:hypothetical protein